MKKYIALALILVIGASVFQVVSVAADGDETLGAPSISIASGSGVIGAGVGLEGTQPGTININVPGSAVNQVLLYWSGVGMDSTIDVDGNAVPGTLIGVDEPGGKTQASTYRADITGLFLVSPGANSLSVGAGLTTGSGIENDGAGLFVIFDDGTTSDITVLDGHDHAYLGGDTAKRKVTVAQTFTFGPALADRTANLVMFFGDVESSSRPNSIDITLSDGVTDTVITLVNPLAGNDGPQFDTLNESVTIPAGAISLTVQAFSEGRGAASFNWINVSLSIPDDEELPALARITGSGWRVTGSGEEAVRSSHGLTLHCDILLSNNLQINWDRGEKWHIDKFVDDAFCEDDPDFTPEPPDAPADTYIGVDLGKLNNKDEAVACWIFEDHGEVAGDPDGPDRALIRIWEPGTAPDISDFDLAGDDPCKVGSIPPTPGNTVLFVALQDIDGGNLQFHFDQPHKK